MGGVTHHVVEHSDTCDYAKTYVVGLSGHEIVPTAEGSMKKPLTRYICAICGVSDR